MFHVNYITISHFKSPYPAPQEKYTKMKTVSCSHFLENDKSLTVKSGLDWTSYLHTIGFLVCLVSFLALTDAMCFEVTWNVCVYVFPWWVVFEYGGSNLPGHILGQLPICKLFDMLLDTVVPLHSICIMISISVWSRTQHEVIPRAHSLFA